MPRPGPSSPLALLRQLGLRVRKSYSQSFLTDVRLTEQIATAAKAYRVVYAKVGAEGAADDDYLMDHTVNIFLMGPDGAFLARFVGDEITPEAMALSIVEYL